MSLGAHDDVAREAYHDYLDEREPRGRRRPSAACPPDPFHRNDPGYDPPDDPDEDRQALTHVVDRYDLGDFE